MKKKKKATPLACYSKLTNFKEQKKGTENADKTLVV